MASLIKNQILKHLSRFTKNLSPDKINLSTLKGEGELSNLELDEAVLTELLELPTWLKLTKAVVNKVSIKIQWTKLKSQPILLVLDEVLLEVVTCETPRPYNAHPEDPTDKSTGKYGFVEKVIDGMSVAINSVNVNFISKTFHASLQLSRVQVYSVNPNWQKVKDLRTTRIKDLDKGEILVFKEVDWQTTRIEANGINLSDPDLSTTPLRLIANQSKIRIAIKKKLHDGSVVSSRVIFLLDDLLWVLTDTQLKAAIVYTKSLQEAIEKSTEQSKKMAAEKLKKQGHIGPTADQLRQQLRQQQSMPSTPSARFFAKYDIITTSYHLITSRIDLHLCDDGMPSSGEGPKRTAEGGAMQITLQKLSLDYYPFHLAGGERKRWYRYADNLGSRNHWVQQLFSMFKEDVKITKDMCSLHSQQQATQDAHHQPERSPSKTHTDSQKLLNPPSAHGFRSRTDSGGRRSEHDSGGQKSDAKGQTSGAHRADVKGQVSGGHRSDAKGHSGGGHRSDAKGQTSGGHKDVETEGQKSQRSEDHKSHGTRSHKQTKLLESCFVLKLEEFTVFQVSLPNNRKGSLKKFLCSDKKQLHLPPEMSVIQLEFTEYFFTEGIEYPVPHPNLYILINPIRLIVHYNTVLWANYFFLNLAKGIKLEELESDKPQPHVDLKLEAVMPRLIFPSENRVPGQLDRPDALQVQVSRFTATNCRVENKSLRKDLQSLLNVYSSASLFSQTDFPNDQNMYVTIPQQFCDHAGNQDNPYIDRATKSLLQRETTHPHPQLHVGTLIQDKAFDIWSITMDQIWMEFTGVPSSAADRPVPFLESVPLSLWVCNPLAMRQAGEGESEQKPHTAESKSEDLHPRRSHHFRKDHSSGTDFERNRTSKKLLRQHYTVTDDSEYVIDPMYHSPNSLLDLDDDTDICNHINGSLLGEMGKDGNKSRSPQLADLYVLLNVGGKLRVQVNHFQYLFLMRLLDSHSDFQKQLESDMELLTPGSSASSSKLCASLVLDELEFAMVCPALPQPSITPSSLTFSSPLTLVPSMNRLGDCIDSRVELPVPNTNITDETGSVTSNLGTSPSRVTMINSGLPGPVVMSTPSDSGARLGSSEPILGQSTSPCPTPASTDSLNRSQRPPFKRTTSAAEVRKSITSAWTAFSDKLKTRSDVSDDSSSISEDFDSMSTNTEMSSDDEFELMCLEDGTEAPAFEHHGIGLPPEAPSICGTASITPDDMALTGITRDLILTEKAKENVSVVVFKMTSSELLIQSICSDITVRTQFKHLSVHETGNIVYEDFNNKFSTAGGYIPVNEDYSIHPPIRLKYMMGAAAGEAGFLDVRCQGLELDFLMSSITHLTDLIEDEILPKPIPMTVQVLDLSLHLKEDRPPANITSPGSLPVNLQISQLTITRGDNGVFHIRGEPLPWISKSNQYLSVSGEKLNAALNQIPDVCLNERLPSLQPSPLDFPLSDHSMKVELERLREQNSDLSQQYTETIDELRTENQALRTQLKKIATFQNNDSYSDSTQMNNSISPLPPAAVEDENNKLIERISFLEDEVKSCLKEKDSLVATLRLLQEELLRSESRRNSNSSSSPSRQRSPRR